MIQRLNHPSLTFQATLSESRQDKDQPIGSGAQLNYEQGETAIRRQSLQSRTQDETESSVAKAWTRVQLLRAQSLRRILPMYELHGKSEPLEQMSI